MICFHVPNQLFRMPNGPLTASTLSSRLGVSGAVFVLLSLVGLGIAADGASAQDVDSVLEDRRAACTRGDLAACAYKAMAYEYGYHGLARDPATAARLRESLCERGHAPACTGLGWQRIAGRGLDVDERAGTALFERACTLGDPEGCNALAESYAQGRGVPKDEARALSLWEDVCTELPRVCAETAVRLSTPGLSLHLDPKRALRFAERACEGEIWGSCAQAGRWLLTVDRTESELRRGRELLSRACDHREDLACMDLAESLTEGDDSAGVAVYEKACARGYRPACRAAGRLTGEPPPLIDDPDFLSAQSIAIHPALPSFEFRLFGDDYGQVFRIELRRPDTEPVDLPWLGGSATTAEPPPRGTTAALRNADLNFDGYQDLLLLLWWGATGNAGYAVWIYDPPTARFVPNPELWGESNPTPRPECAMVSTFSKGGAAGVIFVMDSYRWIDGKPIKVRSVHQDVIRETGGLRATVYEWKDGRLEAVRTIESSGEPIPDLGPCG